MTDLERIDAAIESMPKLSEFDGKIDDAVKIRNEIMIWFSANNENILEALRFQKAMQWQPIETAPRDGSNFLALRHGYHFITVSDGTEFSGCCQGGDIIERTYKPEWVHVTLFKSEDEMFFIDHQGFIFRMNGFAKDTEGLDGDLRISIWMPLPTAELAKQVE